MVALVPWDKVRELTPVPGLRLNRVVGNGYEHVTLNQRHFPPFADVRVRQALAHAVDRDLLVQTILDGQVEVVNGPIQPLSPAYEPNVTRYQDAETAGVPSGVTPAIWYTGATSARGDRCEGTSACRG
jgi:peptide/nickel transport system substrate-binding protein